MKMQKRCNVSMYLYGRRMFLSYDFPGLPCRYMCTYVNMYIYIYCVYDVMYVYIYICVYIYIYTYTYTYVYIYEYEGDTFWQGFMLKNMPWVCLKMR